MTRRRLSDAHFHAVKSATRDLVTACGGLDRTGRLIGVSAQTVSRYQRADHDELMPLAAVVVLEADCGLALVSSAMAALTGQGVNPGSAGDGAAEACLRKLHAGVMRETADMMTEAADAFSDDSITLTELEVLDLATGDMLRAVKAFRGKISRLKAGEP